MLSDERIFLIFHTFEIIDKINPEVIVIETADRFFTMRFPFENGLYNIEYNVRKNMEVITTLMLMFIMNKITESPKVEKKLSLYYIKMTMYLLDRLLKNIIVRNAMEDLPSLETEQKK